MADLVSNRLGRRAYCQALGERINSLRTEREWTRAGFARMLNLAQQTKYAYEIGQRKMPLDRTEQLAKVFRVSLVQLLSLLPVPTFQREPISPRMVRYMQALKQLSASR